MVVTWPIRLRVCDLVVCYVGSADDNEEYPAELYRKFDRVWAELNY